jgi:hypothetical protein
MALASLSLFRDLMEWHVGNGHDSKGLNEEDIERFFDHRSRHWRINAGDRAALRRLLSALRDKGLIAAAPRVELTERERILEAFAAHITHERGLARSTGERHRLLVHRFLQEVYPAGTCEFATLRPEIIIGYVERHALDGSADSGKAMCWTLRAFLRYLHLKDFITAPWPTACLQCPVIGCSIRRQAASRSLLFHDFPSTNLFCCAH